MPESPLLEMIQENARLTGNMCGLTAVHLSQRSGIPFSEVREELNKLFVAGEITIRDGAHGKLVFTNQQLIKLQDEKSRELQTSSH